MLLEFLNLGDIIFEIFVSFEFNLDGDDIFRVTNLAVMYLLEVLLELV